jgi:subtilisin family serine protease
LRGAWIVSSAAFFTACDDPVEGPIGAGVLIIRSFPATEDPRIQLGDHVLLVGAADSTTSNSNYSDYGAPIEIWAGGDGWSSLLPGSGTGDCSGTSCASPNVAGIAALVLAADPTLRGNPDGLHDKLVARAINQVDVVVGSCGERESNRPLVDANAAVQP